MRRATPLAIALVLVLAACGDVGPAADEGATTAPVSPAASSDASPADTTPDTSSPDRTAPDATSPDATSPDPTPPGSATSGVPTPSDDSADTRPPPGTLPEKVPPVETTLPQGPVSTAEVPPELMDTILADAAGRTGVPAGDLVPVRADEIVWNDGSLGCPRPGEIYTQAVINGYWIILRAGEKTLDYRAAATGYFVLCENAFPGSPGNPTG